MRNAWARVLSVAVFSAVAGASLRPLEETWSADLSGGIYYRGIDSAEVNGDGYADLIVGAYTAPSSSGQQLGAAFVFHGSPSSLSIAPSWSFEGPDAGGLFGISVSSAGDLNADEPPWVCRRPHSPRGWGLGEANSALLNGPRAGCRDRSRATGLPPLIVDRGGSIASKIGCMAEALL